MNGYIYCISNSINSKLYIGKTLNPIEKRFSEHCRDSRKTGKEKRPLYDAMRKYGIENFHISLIEEVPLELLSEREYYWIKTKNSYEEGYNATLGGDGKIFYDYQVFIDDYKDGLLVNEIAEKYGCDPSTVTKALRLADIDGKENAFNRQKHKINCYDLEHNFIRSFDSQKEAAEYLIEKGHRGKISSISTNIGRVIKKQRKTAEGYIWETN